ncbi:hypothetical protein EO98_01390 [Methanosarcina sp. 2.H.T.1A.6]|nr:hypothetical protein EO97_04355 [Methanosarcina sp. 2.H.T.1A.15]KKG15912.1 hypothetical protein EO94_10840 [Methanosarcina sp. 2.H.T.1A.3]KKG21051.1 hypothetical protein EO98_01390 [Methanosarcina sp. 2.H.T.1A.6]KKG23797.1 hypothetical protein EO96_07100 [Methanosarcina sp. 2.H.T.1A.8]
MSLGRRENCYPGKHSFLFSGLSVSRVFPDHSVSTDFVFQEEQSFLSGGGFFLWQKQEKTRS